MSFASRRRVGVTVLFGLLACVALVAPACSSDGTVPANDASVTDTSVVVPERDAAPPPIQGSLRVTASVPLRTGEDGTRATFTVALATRPAFPVVVPIASSNEAEIKADASALTFTADDWDKPKTVTLVGQNDEVADGDQQVTISLGPTSSADATQNGLRAEPIKVTNADDDSAGVEVSPPTPSAITTEAGGEARFTVRLRSKPKADVTFALSSTRPSEGRADKTELVFTPSTWSQPQTVVVKGQNDAAADGDQAYAIALAKGQSVDATYAAIDPADVALVNQDDDVPGFFVSGATPSARTTEAGGVVTFTVRLRSMPAALVTIPIASNKPEEGMPSATELVFTPANYDQPQTVTVTGQDDFVDDDDVAYAIVLSPATSTDAVYAAADPPDVALTNADDDTAGIIVSNPSPSATTTEGGGQTTFTVRLASQPRADVTIPVSSSNTAEGMVDKASLTFAVADWNVPQTITVTGQPDNLLDGTTAYAVVLGAASSIDGGYAGMNPMDVTLSNRSVCSSIVLAGAGRIAVAGGVHPDIAGLNAPKHVEAWIRPTLGAAELGILNLGTDTGGCGTAACGGATFRLNMTMNGALSLDVSQGGAVSSVMVPSDEWTFVFAGFSPATGYYVGRALADGTILRRSVSISNGITRSSLTVGQASTIGVNLNNSYFVGAIDVVRIWSRNPSDAEIGARYKTRLTAANEVGLVHQWWTEDGAGGTTTDDVTTQPSLVANGTWQSTCPP